jgi:hypothetical protein
MTFQNNKYLKPYWVFAYDFILHHPRGGLGDVHNTYDSYEEAYKVASDLNEYDTIEIFNRETGVRQILR